MSARTGDDPSASGQVAKASQHDVKSIINSDLSPGEPSNLTQAAKGTKLQGSGIPFDRRDDFQYTSINAHEQIRLLRITSGKDSKDVRLELSTRALSIFKPGHAYKDPQTPYIALSYTWGDRGEQVEIQIGGKRTVVSRNCHYALYQLSLHFEESQHFWIDAVCINQSDLAEKGSQVEMMAEVYKQAEQVMVAVGPHADDSDFLVKIMGDFANRFPKDRYGVPRFLHRLLFDDQSDILLPYPELTGRNFPELDLGSALRALKALEKFSSRSYWKRVWTVQELTFAQTIFILCENAKMELDHFRNFSCYFSSERFDPLFSLQSDRRGVTSSKLSYCLEIHQLEDLWHTIKTSLLQRPEISSLAMWVTVDQKDSRQIQPLDLGDYWWSRNFHHSDSKFIRLTRPNVDEYRLEKKFFEGLRDFLSRRKSVIPTYLEAVSRYRHLNCSNKRDMLYGLLSIIDHPETPSKPVPDYNKSVLEVALDALNMPYATKVPQGDALPKLEHSALICEAFHLDVEQRDIRQAIDARTLRRNPDLMEQPWAGYLGKITSTLLWPLKSNKTSYLLWPVGKLDPSMGDISRRHVASVTEAAADGLQAIVLPPQVTTDRLRGFVGKHVKPDDYLISIEEKSSCQTKHNLNLVIRRENDRLFSIVGQANIAQPCGLGSTKGKLYSALEAQLDVHLDSEDLMVMLCQRKRMHKVVSADDTVASVESWRSMSYLNSAVCRTKFSSFVQTR